MNQLHKISSEHDTQDQSLTLVTATFAPLLISWTTLSACPLCAAMRRRSESARTSAASCWLMKQGDGCCCHGQMRCFRWWGRQLWRCSLLLLTHGELRYRLRCQTGAGKAASAAVSSVATNSTNYQDSSPSSSQLLGREQKTHGMKTSLHVLRSQQAGKQEAREDWHPYCPGC